MILVLDLTPEEETRLQQEAARRGVDVKQYARQRLGLMEPSKPDAENQALIDLLRLWREEDAAMTLEEAEEAESEWEALQRNLNANRAATGEERLF